MKRVLNPNLPNYRALGRVLRYLYPQRILKMVAPFPNPLLIENPKPDHFYVMSYLAQRLREAGYSRVHSFLIPFAFNTEYEIGRFGTPIVMQAKLIKAYLQTNSDKAVTEIPHMPDVYLGYLGSMFGVDPSIVNNRALPNEVFFIRGFLRGPRFFVQLADQLLNR